MSDKRLKLLSTFKTSVFVDSDEISNSFKSISLLVLSIDGTIEVLSFISNTLFWLLYKSILSEDLLLDNKSVDIALFEYVNGIDLSIFIIFSSLDWTTSLLKLLILSQSLLILSLI